MAAKTSFSTGVMALGAAAGCWFWPAAAIAGATAVPLAAPIGVTIQQLGTPYTPDGLFRDNQRAGLGMTYADAKGMTLYTHENDTEANKSTCYDDCAKAWPPLVATKGSKPFGDWTLVARTDGTTQWAYRGKPLYAFAKDTIIGDAQGVGGVGKSGKKGVNADSAVAKNAKALADAAAGKQGAPRPTGFAMDTEQAAPKAAGPWRIAYYKPANDVKVPAGIAIESVVDAEGQVFVDTREHTLYVFDGDAKNEKKACAVTPCPWKPLAAAQIANPVPNWTIISREDGVQQWAYKGQPLYTYDGDLQADDANGVGVNKHWNVAYHEQYYRPADVVVRVAPGRGKILATASGMTLYRREGHLFRTGGHGIPRTSPTSPAMGREVGTNGCHSACREMWKPLKASANAQPSGFWDVVTREDDGTRQWSYKGYALYTYAGDKKPGDVNGYDQYDIYIGDDLHDIPEYPIVPTINQFSLYWTYAYP